MDANETTALRHSTGASFEVPVDKIVTDTPPGYDLSLMRDIAADGLAAPVTVEPLDDHRFKVVDGKKRMAVIHLMIRSNTLAYDSLRGLMRPAQRVFALIWCRLRPGSRRKP